MKQIVGLLLAVMMFGFSACKSSKKAIQTGVSNITNPEVMAKTLTDNMVKVLSLDNSQAEKVLLLNLVNYKMLQKLKPSESDKLTSVKEKYNAEMKEILNSLQFEKFLREFGKS